MQLLFCSKVLPPPQKTDVNSFVFICMNKNTAKTRRFHSTFLVQSPGYTNCIPPPATLYETGITIYSSSFDPKDIGCISAHMSFTFSSYFVLFCCVFLLRCPPQKRKAQLPFTAIFLLVQPLTALLTRTSVPPALPSLLHEINRDNKKETQPRIHGIASLSMVQL